MNNRDLFRPRRSSRRACAHDWVIDVPDVPTGDRLADGIDDSAGASASTMRVRYRCETCGAVEWFTPDERGNDVTIFSNPATGKTMVLPGRLTHDAHIRWTGCLRPQDCCSEEPTADDALDRVSYCRRCFALTFAADIAFATLRAGHAEYADLSLDDQKQLWRDCIEWVTSTAPPEVLNPG